MRESAARVGWMLVAPLLLVNSAAIWGQAGWAHDHVTTPWWSEILRWTIAVLFAVAVESVGIFLAGMAHAARMADQSAGLLQLGSYLVGLLVGLLNYWHFAGSAFRPTAQAVAFGALSALSPWLWAIYSRYRNRDRLTQLGQVDMRGLKLSTSRKFWHPFKSISVIRFASWEGIVQPDAAVRAWQATRMTSREEIQAANVAYLKRAFGDLDEPAESDEDEPEALPEGRADPWSFSRELRLVKPAANNDPANGVNGRLFPAPVYPPEEPAEPRHSRPDDPLNTALRATPADGVDPVFREPERPASDEELISFHGNALRQLRDAGKLNRYQVEKLTGANRRQVDRILDQINSETDQKTTMVDGAKR